MQAMGFCRPQPALRGHCHRRPGVVIFPVVNHREIGSMRQQLALLASIAALFAFIAFSAFSAQAMPAAPLKGASNSSQVIHVAGGCGRGWHRGPYGHCRRN
jgi:hypothetical protein